MARENAAVRKHPVTWFLIADGQAAQIYTRRAMQRRIPMSGNGRHHHYQAIETHEFVPLQDGFLKAPNPNYDVGTGSIGRVFESATAARHAYSPHIDAYEEIKRNFMRMVAEWLAAAEKRHAFGRLVLVAPAKMLGELRRQLSGQVLDAVAGEVPKDLTHCTPEELPQHLDHLA